MARHADGRSRRALGGALEKRAAKTIVLVLLVVVLTASSSAAFIAAYYESRSSDVEVTLRAFHDVDAAAALGAAVLTGLLTWSLGRDGALRAAEDAGRERERA